MQKKTIAATGGIRLLCAPKMTILAERMDAMTPAAKRGGLVYRSLWPGRNTVTQRIESLQKLTERLRIQVDRGETAALRRGLEELRVSIRGIQTRSGLDAAVRRAVEARWKNYPIPANGLLLSSNASGTLLLHSNAGAARPLRLALRRWAFLAGAHAEEPGRAPVLSAQQLRHRLPPREEKGGREAEAGERTLEAQRLSTSHVRIEREELVTRTEVLRMLRELPPPDLGELTERVKERLDSTLRAERRRYGRGN